MSQYDYDLFVIGAGSGGVRAARMSASYGAKVAVAEDTHLGGTCVNVGCVPKKLLVYASHFAEDFASAQSFGWSAPQSSFSWQQLIANKDAEIKRLNGIYQNILQNSGAEIIHGRAGLIDQHTVEVAGQRYSAKNILVATGGKPYVPEFPGSEHVITSNEAFYLQDLPKRVLVVGGGYIAVEFAGIFNGLGAATTLSYRGPKILKNFDREVGAFVTEQVKHKGIDLQLNSQIESIEKQASGELAVLFASGNKAQYDCVMYATGRVPRFEGLGLDNAGVALDQRGYIKVDQNYRTSADNIFAVGDILGRVELTPVALAEGMAVARHLFKPELLAGKPAEIDYDNIATAVFCQPNIATVGLTEEQAAEHFDAVAVYTSQFKAMKHSLDKAADEKTFMKLLVDQASDKVIGCHMVGPDAGEIIQGIAVAIKAGATKAHFDSTIGIHPTAAEEFVTMREPNRVLSK